MTNHIKSLPLRRKGRSNATFLIEKNYTINDIKLNTSDLRILPNFAHLSTNHHTFANNVKRNTKSL